MPNHRGRGQVSHQTLPCTRLLPEEVDGVAGEEDEEEVEDGEGGGDEDDNPDAPFDPLLFGNAEEHKGERDFNEAGSGDVEELGDEVALISMLAIDVVLVSSEGL